MAQKIIGIKLEVDAEQGKKIGLVFQQAEKSADGLAVRTKELQKIETERAALVDKQAQAYSKLVDTIERANTAIANNARGANLGPRNAEIALRSYNTVLDQTTTKLEALTRKQQELSLTKRSFISGISEKDVQLEEKRLSAQKQQSEIARIMTAAYNEQQAAIAKVAREEQARLATLKSAAYYGMKEQTSIAPSKAPAVNYNYTTGVYKDKEAEYRAYMLSMEEMAHAENEKYKKGLETKKFADQAYINSAKVMYAQMFDEIAAKEAEVARRAKPVDARNVNAIVQNPYASYNTATGAKSFKPIDTFDPQAEAAKIRAAVEYENTIRDAGRNKQLVAQAKHAKDTLEIEQKLAKDIELVRQRVSGGFITKAQGFEEQRKAVEEYGRALKALPSLNPHIAEHKNLFIHIGEIIGAYRVLNFTLNSVINAVKAIPKIGIELESTVASLTATMGAMETGGSSAGMVAAMRALNEEAKRTGINIATLRENFRGFQASTSLAGESLDSTWNIFTKLNTTITGLHLNADKAKGIFNALAQIFNKNKVQSEELVKQLGNLLPGAFASFAKANQGTFKTTQDLIEQMRKGQVFAHQTVENFANFLAERFGPAFALAERGLNANLGRMETSFTKLGEAIYGTTSGPILAFVKGITSINEGLIEAIEGTTAFGKSLQTAFSIAGTAALSATAGYLVIVVSRMERLIALAKGVGAVA
jgi:tape measure domain-containing protein